MIAGDSRTIMGFGRALLKVDCCICPLTYINYSNFGVTTCEIMAC